MIIQNLDPNKAHGHDNISISLLKVCGPSIYAVNALKNAFSQCLKTGVFPSEWKKGNIVPIHKKRGQAEIEKLPFSFAATYL